MKSLLYSLLICLSFELILSWHLNTNINIKNTLPTSSSSSSSSLSSPSISQSSSSSSSMSSISPSVLKMIKNDRLSLQINANLMFTNLLLVQSKPYRPSSLKLLSAISSSILSKDSQIYEKVKRIFTIIDPIFRFLKNAMITLILFIKSKLGIKDHKDTQMNDKIAVNQDKDIQQGRKWSSNKIREIEQRDKLVAKKTSTSPSPKLKDIPPTNAKKYWPTGTASNNVKPSLPKRTYSTNTTEDLEKFWPPVRLYNMTIGGGEKLNRQSVPLLIPNPIKAESNETKIQSLSNEIKALSQEIQLAQQVEESKEDEIIDPISELQETIEAIVDDYTSSKLNLDAEIGLKSNLTVDIKLSDISLDAIANLTQNNVLTEYGIIDLSSKIFLNNTVGIWKLEENRIINGLICETMVDRIILKDKEQIYSTEIPGSKGLSWSFDAESIEMKILRGTSSTEYIRDNSGKLSSVKVTRPPPKGPYDRTPTMVNYRGYLLGDRIIGDVFTSSYAMGNITTDEKLSGKFQLQRYTFEEISLEKKAIEIKENLKLWNEIKK